MSTRRRAIISLCACLGLIGCATDNSIVAGAVDTIGIKLAAGTTDQGASLTMGFKGAKFAVVPVENSDGRVLSRDEAYSVFAMLGADASGGVVATGLGAEVEQVLATGRAADIWAKGRAQRTLTVADIARAKAAGLSADEAKAFQATGVLR